MNEIEKKIAEFNSVLESEDAVILQKLQIELQIEQLHQTLISNELMLQRTTELMQLFHAMDWKLWEALKILKPELDNEATVEDTEFKIVDGKYVKR